MIRVVSAAEPRAWNALTEDQREVIRRGWKEAEEPIPDAVEEMLRLYAARDRDRRYRESHRTDRDRRRNDDANWPEYGPLSVPIRILS